MPIKAAADDLPDDGLDPEALVVQRQTVEHTRILGVLGASETAGVHRAVR